MPENIYLGAIELKAISQKASWISSVRCVLSNSATSPVFEKEGHIHLNQKIINFNENRPVKGVQAWNNITGDFDQARRLTFIDGQGDELDSFNPQKMDR